MKKHKEQTITYWHKDSFKEIEIELLNEEPLSIRIQGKQYAVIMRTPGDEIAHAAGFCLSEGIIENRSDVSSIAFCGEESNVVTITLSESRRLNAKSLLERKGYLSQSSCGICGKELIQDLGQNIKPVSDESAINIRLALNCIEKLSDYQPLREKTRASHGAAIFNLDGKLLSASEDVGRHNALDKAIGKLFLIENLTQAKLAVLSSRISYELVQKAAMARIPIVIAVSRPTLLAVELASEMNMALACISKDSGLYIFCGKDRFVRS